MPFRFGSRPAPQQSDEIALADLSELPIYSTSRDLRRRGPTSFLNPRRWGMIAICVFFAAFIVVGAFFLGVVLYGGSTYYPEYSKMTYRHADTCESIYDNFTLY